MKLIKNIVFVDIDEKEKLLINSLNGLVDSINIPTFSTLKKWEDMETIIPSSNNEQILFETLKKRGYLVKSNEEEYNIKNDLLKKLKESHLNKNTNCRHITFVMTYDCNFRCPYCFEGSKPNKGLSVMTFDMIDNALSLAQDNLESVGLFGGEPLLPITKEAVRYLISKTKDKTFNITTNGYYLIDFFDILKDLNISYIMVTLDGDQNYHDSKRYLANGNPTYQKIMLGIKKYLENRIPIRIRMNLNMDNIDNCLKLRDNLLEKFKSYEQFISFELSPIMQLPLEVKSRIIKLLYEKDSKFTYEDRNLRNVMHGKFSPILNSFSINKRLHPKYCFCHSHEKLLLVDPEGDIYSCLLAVGNKKLRVGTFYPEVIWKENSMLNRNIETISKCENCEKAFLCGGGCPLKLKSYDDLMQPYCNDILEDLNVLLPHFYIIEKELKSN